MSRYIDANLIGDRVSNGVVDYEVIKKIPTADVVEVVHGKNISKGGFLCSVCKFGDFNGFHGYEPNFCPNCGAKMEVTE